MFVLQTNNANQDKAHFKIVAETYEEINIKPCKNVRVYESTKDEIKKKI